VAIRVAEPEYSSKPGQGAVQANFERFRSKLEPAPSFAEIVSTRHAAVREYLKNNHAGFTDSKLIGSLQRKTRIQPLPDQSFDIDILVIMGAFYSWATPGTGVYAAASLAALHGTLSRSDRYGSMAPITDAPTVRLHQSGNIEVELVPAYLDQVGHNSAGDVLGPAGRGYWVPKDGGWVMADYDFEAQYLTEQNTLAEGYLIPTIKMLKSARRRFFPDLPSFALEIIATPIVVAAVRTDLSLLLRPTYADLIRQFFRIAPSRLQDLIKVPYSKSPGLTLSAAEIAALREMFARISSHLDDIPRQSSTAVGWQTLFGDAFPISV